MKNCENCAAKEICIIRESYEEILSLIVDIEVPEYFILDFICTKHIASIKAKTPKRSMEDDPAVIAQREYHRAWRAANRDKTAQHRKNYWEKQALKKQESQIGELKSEQKAEAEDT